MEDPKYRLNREEVFDYLTEVYPPCADRIVIESLQPMSGRIRFRVKAEDWRPGGTVSGPVVFTAADASIYILVLSMVGKELGGSVLP